MTDSRAPTQIGRYPIEGVLGRGGMGLVYASTHPGLGLPVAIKVLQRSTEMQRRRFLRETAALTKIDHPAVVKILEAGEQAGALWYAMRRIQGESLEERLRRGPLGIDEVFELGVDLAAALDAAHQVQVAHRDVKPANVMIQPDGSAVLTDFGMGKDEEVKESIRLSKTGQPMGSPQYWSPEQAGGEPAGFPSDVYSLGATLYAALTGSPPFRGKTLIEFVVAARKHTPPPPSRSRPEVPAWLDDLVLSCLAKRPEQRLASPLAVKEALEAGRRPTRRGPSILLGVGLVGAGLVIALVIVSSSSQPAGPPTAATVAPAESVEQVEPPQVVQEDETPSRDPELSQAYAENAAAKGLSADHAGALADSERALELDPENQLAWLQRGNARDELGDPAGAVEDYTRVIELNPNDSAALYNRACSRAGLGDHAGAIEDYTRSLTLDPDDVDAWFNLSLSRLQVGDHAGAVQDCTELLARAPGDAEAWLNRGKIQAHLGNYREAIADFDQALSLDPAVSTYDQRGQAKALSGDYRGGAEDLALVAEARPDDPAAVYNHGRARLELGELDLALESLDRAVKLDTGYGHAWLFRGRAKAGLDDLEGALADYGQAVALVPDDAQVWFYRGQARSELGEPGASEDLERALQLDPSADWASEAREILERRR